ncbi:MAG: protein translocase subunit SecD [Microbacteriaceae bacterium]|nr:protein translocase subunit SecD [Microbacteriaceae bacterium]
MATSSTSTRAIRSLVWLLMIFAAFGALITSAAVFDNESWTPKLALDLEGGTQIILAPQVADGASVSEEELAQAVGIIRQRVDATGVSEAEVTTQGGTNIIVAIPGTPDQATLDRIRSSAKLEFRPVLVTDQASTVDQVAADIADPSLNVEGIDINDFGTLETPAVWPEPTGEPANASDRNWVTPELYATYLTETCDALDAAGANIADPTQPLVICADDQSFKYILGPVEVDGDMVSDASANFLAGSSGVQTNEWGVYLTFNAEGTRAFSAVTTRLTSLPGVQNQFAIVLDGKVISAPRTLAAIPDGKPVISGSFTEASSKALADQLKFGALPIGFEVQSSETVTPTLGVAQLESGILAGLIGLALVVLYAIFQYRMLAVVTIGSLAVAAVFTLLVTVYLSQSNDYRLSLAGVAGLIVGIGVTADSFIVYFERVRDELREGRTLISAVEAGWRRARRTILVSGAVNLLASVVLFVLAVGNVRGFAFTLGVMTVVDILIVVLFTHPLLQLLARTRLFTSGHALTGLDGSGLGAVYRGRGEFRVDDSVSKSKRESIARESSTRQSIAERKALENGGSQ